MTVEKDKLIADAAKALTRSVIEIKDLRCQLSLLRPKAEAYDMLYKVLNLMPSAPQVFGDDVVWFIEKEIERLQHELMPVNCSSAPCDIEF